MEGFNYNNYLQLFASEFHVHPSDISEGEYVGAINRLTAARREFVERGLDGDLNSRKSIAKEIVQKYDLGKLPNIFDTDFTELDEEITSAVKGSLKKQDIDDRVVVVAKTFSTGVLNNDLQSFSTFVNHMKELDRLDESLITPKDEERYELVSAGIKGVDRYDYYLMYGSTIRNSRTTFNALYDISSFVEGCSEDEITRTMPLVTEYYRGLLDIGNYISRAADPKVTQEELDARFERMLSKHKDDVESINGYNETLNYSNVINELFRNARKRQIPEVLLKDLSSQAYEAFSDYRYGFDLKEKHRSYVDTKIEQHLLVYVDQDENKYLDESAILALLGEETVSEYIDKDGGTYVSSRSHIIEKGIPQGMHFNRNIKSKSLDEFEYNEYLGLYRVTDEQLEYLIHCYEERNKDVTVIVDYKEVENKKEQLNDMLNHKDEYLEDTTNNVYNK